MRILPVAAALVLALGSQASAEPLDHKQVSAEAKWMVHVDFDALRAAKTAQRIGDAWLRRDSSKRHLEEIRKATGMGPTRDVHSISFYGSRFQRLDGVVIVRAEVDRPRLLDLAGKWPDYRTSPHGSRELHSWTRAKGTKHEHTVTGCFHGPAVMVFGRDTAEVKAALDVLDGKSAGLAEDSPLLGADVPAGAVLHAAASELAAADVPFKSPILTRSEVFSLAVGEYHGRVFARATLVAQSPEVAAQVRQILDGFLAMAKLQHRANEDAMKILEAVRATTHQKTVSVAWEGSAEAVLELIEKAWSKKASKPKPAD